MVSETLPKPVSLNTNVSVTYAHCGKTTISFEGVTVAALSDRNTVGATLRRLGVQPEHNLHIRNTNGSTWRVLARNLYETEQ